MKKLSIDTEGRHHVNHRKPFEPSGTLAIEFVELAAEFAMRMTYLGEGQHKATRSGGLHERSTREIFSDTFQGKLAEFAILQVLSASIDKSYLVPSLKVAPLGYWEEADILGPGISIEVKSTKHFGNLLLLEKENWNVSGDYRHGANGGGAPISHVALVRISPSIHDKAKALERRHIGKTIDKRGLIEELLSDAWSFDLPGFATSDDLKWVFHQNHLILRGSMLGPKGVRMDADNYYIQTGDLRPLSELLPKIRNQSLVASDAVHEVEIVSDNDRDVGTRTEGEVLTGSHTSDEMTSPFPASTGPEYVAQNESQSTDRRGSKWLRAEDEELIELFTQGQTFTDIARTMRRSQNSIASRANKLYLEDQGYLSREPGQASEKVSKSVGAKVLTLYLQGTPVEDISATLGLRIATVAKELMLARVLTPVSLDDVVYHLEAQTRRPWTTEEDKELLELYLSGKTLKEMTESLGRSNWALLFRLHRLDQISEEDCEEFIDLLHSRKLTP